MTKTLTEQWREGTLPENTYYVQFICGRYGVYEFEQYKGFGFDNDLAYIKEVLAPVPSYDKVKEMSQKIGRLELDNEVLDNELKELATKNDSLAMENGRLQERLEIATKALKEYKEDYFISEGGGMYVNPNPHIARKALKEMEGVK